MFSYVNKHILVFIQTASKVKTNQNFKKLFFSFEQKDNGLNVIQNLLSLFKKFICLFTLMAKSGKVFFVKTAVYMTAAVACGWAGAMMRKPLAKRRKRRKSKWYTDRPTDQSTDQPTDGPTQ